MRLSPLSATMEAVNSMNSCGGSIEKHPTENIPDQGCDGAGSKHAHCDPGKHPGQVSVCVCLSFREEGHGSSMKVSLSV